MKYIYDIRTPDEAFDTLESITGVPGLIWAQNCAHEKDYECIDDFVESVAKTYGHLPKDYYDWDFIFSHVTTSEEGCESILKHGLLDLVRAYESEDSELRKFLDKCDIKIFLSDCKLQYRGRTFDISYDGRQCPSDDTPEYASWRVGVKFYYDFTVCGFLSADPSSAYHGIIDRCPEILLDMDTLLQTRLSSEWAENHQPFEVIARVMGKDIFYAGYGSDEKEKVLYFLSQAYLCAFHPPIETVLLLKNNIEVPPENILEIKPWNFWNNKF